MGGRVAADRIVGAGASLPMKSSKRARRESSKTWSELAVGVLVGGLLGAMVGAVEGAKRVPFPSPAPEAGYAAQAQESEHSDPLVVGPMIGMLGGIVAGVMSAGVLRMIRKFSSGS